MATIRVSFSELRSTGYYSHVKAEASIETESQDVDKDFPELWNKVRSEVRGQLQKALEPEKLVQVRSLPEERYFDDQDDADEPHYEDSDDFGDDEEDEADDEGGDDESP